MSSRIAIHATAVRTTAVIRARKRQECWLWEWDTGTLHWGEETPPAALEVLRFGTVPPLDIHSPCANSLVITEEVAALSLWLILVAVWLAPAAIVGLLLARNALGNDTNRHSESDAPPAE